MADQKAFKKRLKVLMNRTENLQCVDCNERQPRWASLIKPPPGTDMGMGAFMCLECSGSHRRLGVHISFVRSVNLDSWKEHEVQIMENGGNNKINAAYEAHLARSGAQKPTNLFNGQQRERYIRDKYERRKFYDPSALEDYEPEVEEVVAKPTRRSAASKGGTAAMSRAPSDAARRRAEARNSRVVITAAPERPVTTAVTTAAPAPPVDLLDFASFPSAPVAPAAPAQAPATLDMFADMTVSAPNTTASAAPAAPAHKSNDDILSLFATPQSNNNNNSNNFNNMGGMMMNNHQDMPAQNNNNNNMQMMSGMQQHQMNPAMGQHQQQQQQQQLMMQQQQMMMMRQQQQGQQQNNMPQGMMMQGMPQNNNMMMNNSNNNTNMSGQQQQQQMMMQQMQAQQMQAQQNGMQGMMMGGGGMAQHQHQPGMQNNPMMQQQQQSNDGGFGAPMGSGPSISNIQGTPAPPKEDPFASFGFNAFQ